LGVYYDTENPAHYLETFVMDTWDEHLRQHDRMTQPDRQCEDLLRSFEVKPAVVSHFIYARPGGCEE
jgi:hypothetical protein